MKRILKTLLVTVLILLVVVSGICLWQRDNIAAIMASFSHSREDISGMMAENDKKIEQTAEKVDGVTVRDMTEEEKQALRDGEIDREELLERMTAPEETQQVQETEPVEDPVPTTPGAAPSDQVTEAPAEIQEDSNQKKLSKYLAEIYLMKDEYTAWLEAKYDEAIAEYQALDEAERTTAAKYSIGMRCMKEALAKEKECDALMAELEKKIFDLLTEMGEDTSLVDDIQAAYEEEKELKKAYYLGLHD